jgi:hypothetical protein
MMRAFLINVGYFTAPLMLFMLAIFLNENGFSDPFYLKISTPKQTSLIVGTSRAAQGIMPSVLNRELKEIYGEGIFNYAFTVSHSPFGKVYTESISNKLKDDSSKRLFIIAVDPWSVSATGKDPNDENEFPENEFFLAKTANVAFNPNLEYLMEFYPDPFYNILMKRISPGNSRLHEDGWLEITVNMKPASVKERTDRKLKEYRESNAVNFKFSEKRFQYLSELILMLKKLGDVYLVRLPVHEEMLKIENSTVPDFNERLIRLERECRVPYLDMTPNGSNYKFTDGNHLHKTSSKQVSLELARWISSCKVNERLMVNELK